MLGAGMEEFLRKIEKLTCPIHYIQKYSKPHFETVGISYPNNFTIFVNSGYERKENGKRKGNQGDTGHSLIISNNVLLANIC